MMIIDETEIPLTLFDDRIERAIRQNQVRLLIIDPVQAFIGADVDMNRANEVRPIFRKLGDEGGFRWIGGYDINADDLLNGREGRKVETKLERGTKLIEELLAEGKVISLKELQEEATELNISPRTMKDVRRRMGDRLEYGKGEGRENTSD